MLLFDEVTSLISGAGLSVSDASQGIAGTGGSAASTVASKAAKKKSDEIISKVIERDTKFKYL